MFQSTPPAWGATASAPRFCSSDKRFNPRPPRGGRRATRLLALTVYAVSIHAPRVGGDHASICHTIMSRRFNPRPPRGGRRRLQFLLRCREVSIHAPRVGGDRELKVLPLIDYLFQSTPPAWGATLRWPWRSAAIDKFQSTPPAWGATESRYRLLLQTLRFQSTPPAWGATAVPSSSSSQRDVSIHAPRVGGDASGRAQLADDSFQSTPPAWGATSASQHCFSES